MFDIKQIEKEAEAEIAKERAEKARAKVKDSLRRIAAAEAVVRNLRNEHAVLMAEIGADV